MKWKCVIVGGLVFWIATNIVGFVTGPLIHEGVLKATYQENSEYWRPELNEDPPNLGALMPMWLGMSLISSLVVAGLYSCRSCGAGTGWKRGMNFGLGLGVFMCAIYLNFFGVFGLPSKIWIYWGVEALLVYALCGAVMGWAVGKWCSE